MASSDRHGRATRAGATHGEATAHPQVGRPQNLAERLGSLLRREVLPNAQVPLPHPAALAPDPTLEVLRSKERFLSTLLDNLPGYAYRCRNDRPWTVEFISDGVRKVTGYAPADFLAGRVSIGLDLIHPDHRARIWHIVQDALARGEAFQCTYPITTAVGEVRWMWEQGRAVHGCHGTFEALEGFVTDVTERVLAERALSDTDRTLESAQEVAHVGSWSRGADRPERIRWSAEMARIFGVEAEGFDGEISGYFAMVHPDDLPGVRAAHDTAHRGEGGFDLEYRVQRRDGALRWVHDRGEVVRDERGQVRGTTGVCQDITERTELRAQVAQAQTMAALGRLAGGIGHDFNNLLQVLEGYTATLMAGTSADTARQADLQQIRSVGERAGKLTQQLLALGGRHPLRLRAVDLPALVAQMLPSLTEAVGERIQVEFAAQVEGTCVQADAAALEQTVRELCLYGRDTMPHGGRLRLRITEVVADAQFQRERPWADRGRYLLLTVTDTGPGLTPAERERIFEPFFAADRGSAARNLGLAAVRGLVTQQGGMIEAHATPGRGTGFHVYLPASAPVPALGTVAAASAAVPRPAGGRPTVLFAEDDLAVCELASRTLREAGYDVLVAHDGAQALACFDARQGRVDVIVLDMVMPMLGGERVCEEIARRDPAARIILTSGYDAEALGEWEGCRREGLLLQKPYPPARLVSAVREALAGRAG